MSLPLRLRLEARPEPSRVAGLLSPLTAVLATLVIGFVLFTALGKDPFAAFHAFFIKPVDSAYGVSELLLKASPLMLIATGLAVGYRANVWNIGAEGQLLLGRDRRRRSRARVRGKRFACCCCLR